MKLYSTWSFWLASFPSSILSVHLCYITYHPIVPFSLLNNVPSGDLTHFAYIMSWCKFGMCTLLVIPINATMNICIWLAWLYFFFFSWLELELLSHVVMPWITFWGHYFMKNKKRPESMSLSFGQKCGLRPNSGLNWKWECIHLRLYTERGD
jgi:hypothetical protein